MKKHIKPTESELEVLQILWEKGACSVREVHEVQNQKREIGYTTTLKIMQLMYEKGMIDRQESGKMHIYTALVTEADTQGQLLERFVDSVFKGSAMKLVMQALGNKKTSTDELAQIKKLIDDMEKGGDQ